MKLIAILSFTTFSLIACGNTEEHKSTAGTTPTTSDESVSASANMISIEEENTLKSPSHTLFNELLKANVSSDGSVNYDGFKENRSQLNTYLTTLEKNPPTAGWSKNERLSYWMNAYNAMTIDLILRNSPLTSIKDIKDPWDQSLWKIDGKSYNLNEIEHEILRKMDDPRIHFGINCASISCPPLLNEAFTAAKVNVQLDKVATKFINDASRNEISADAVKISKIFKWFSKDFKTNGSIIDYLNKFSKVTINSNARVSYKDYDWSLNN